MGAWPLGTILAAVNQQMLKASPNHGTMMFFSHIHLVDFACRCSSLSSPGFKNFQFLRYRTKVICESIVVEGKRLEKVVIDGYV